MSMDKDALSVECDQLSARDVSRINCAVRTNPRMFPAIFRIPCTLENLRQIQAMGAQMDDSVGARLERMERLQGWVERMKVDADVEPISTPPVKATLYRHQIRAYNIGMVLRSFAALMDMGTGKTLTTIAIIGRRFQEGKINRVLIVAPTSVCAVWPSEFQRWADFGSRVELLLGDREKRVAKLRSLMQPGIPGMVPSLRVAVINYESTWRLEEELIAFAPDMVVCDESQRIKSPTAQQAKAMHRIGDHAKYKMILTGTPVQNDTRDIWSQYRFLQPAIFGTRYHAFMMRYAIMGGYGNHQYLGARNLNELTRKTHSIAYRVTKEECLDLPEQTFEDRAVEVDEKTRKLYKRIATDSCAELADGGEITASIVLTKLLRLQQVTGGYVKLDDGSIQEVSTAKMDALEDIVQDYCISGGHKLVVFARFRAELDGINKMLERLGVRSVYIAGDVQASSRDKLVAQFQTDPRTLVFVGQIDACAEGITLTAANTAVYYSVNWNLAKYQQSLARIHRIGQRNACTYLHLIVPGTIDEKIMDALKAKEDIAKSITDNWQTYFNI